EIASELELVVCLRMDPPFLIFSGLASRSIDLILLKLLRGVVRLSLSSVAWRAHQALFHRKLRELWETFPLLLPPRDVRRFPSIPELFPPKSWLSDPSSSISSSNVLTS